MALSIKKSAILSIDIGTTYLKCTLYDLELNVLGYESAKLNVIQPQDGFFELEPNEFIELLKSCAKNCISRAVPSTIVSVGVSTQRNSVLTWDKTTGKPNHNFILWNDKRNARKSEEMNSKISLFGLKHGARFLTLFINNQRFKTFSKYRYATEHVSVKLAWILSNIRNLNKENTLMGCIESWVLWKLTKQQQHATDVTCACCTGIYDLYLKSWSNIMCAVSQIPMNLLPNVYDTCHAFGDIDKSHFGTGEDLPITAIIGDAQSSILAEGAYQVGDVVITIGTGAFLSVNVGDEPKASLHGAYPLVGFKYLDDNIYIIHTPISSVGISIEWAKSIGLFNEYDEMEAVLNSVDNSDGVYFIPAFGPLEVDAKDTKAAAGFLGVRPSTTKAHLFRAIIDSIVFSIKAKFDLLMQDINSLNITLNSIKICGGVSRSDFLCRYLSYALQFPIERTSTCHSSSSLGAAILSGLGAGIWVKKEELVSLRKNVQIFRAAQDNPKKFQNFEADEKRWNKAIQRAMGWYNEK